MVEYLPSKQAVASSSLVPRSMSNRYRALQQFFKWAVHEGEIAASPMVKMKPPHIPEEPPPLVSDADLARLLKACEGKDFLSRRDAAIIANQSHRCVRT